MKPKKAVMSEEQGLAGKLLVAMPGLQDPYFERTVLFVCTHSVEGALGLVVNQPHIVTMEEVITPLGLQWHRPEPPVVFNGGPVALDRGFILYETDLGYPGYVRVGDNLCLGTNPDILRHLVQGEDRGRFLFALGYSGWGSGQLEAELRDNVWLVSSVDRRILFDLPAFDRWNSAIRCMGINPTHLVDPGSDRIN